MDKELKKPVEFIESIANGLIGSRSDFQGTSAIEKISHFFGFDAGFIYKKDVALGSDLYIFSQFGNIDGLELPEKIDSSRAMKASEKNDDSYFARQLGQDLFNASPNPVSLLALPFFDGNRIIAAAGLASSSHSAMSEKNRLLAKISLILLGATLRTDYNVRQKGYFRDSLEKAMNSAGVNIYASDYHTYDLLYINKAMAALYGCPEDLPGIKCYEVMNPTRTDECTICPRSRLKDKNGNPTRSYSWDYQQPSNGRWFRIFNTVFKWEKDRLAHVITSTDITESKRNELLVEKMALDDALTGIPNRRSFERDFEKVISRAQRDEKTGFILFIDLDNFKHINDAFGHEKGDELLISVASYLNGFSSELQQAYRYGGDEFIMVIEDVRQDAIKELVDILLFRFTDPWNLDGLEYFCTASIGVASFPADGVTYDVLLNTADKAMYEAKKKGKSTVVYSHGRAKRQSEKMEFEFALRRAVLNGCGEFEVLFHPVVDIHTGEWAGVEALARWNSQTYGVVSPDDFIPVCEQLGLIFELEKWLLSSALKEVVSWDMDLPDFFLSFNVSAMEFYHDEFAEFLLSSTAEHGYPHHRLMLEIADTATDCNLNIDRIKPRLDKLRMQDISIALDRFGIGYSSLERIQELAVDFIKIDRKLVTDFLGDDIKIAVVQAIITLAGAAKAKVCAEGVESKEHLDCLKNVGCDYVQGRYYFEPSPGTETLKAIKKNRSLFQTQA